MSSLSASLQNAADSLGVFENAIGVVQSNVTNASTPGYVNRTPALTTDVSGNVALAPTQDSRNQFAEQAVWKQSELLGAATQKASSLSAIQSQFDVTGKSGIPAALSSLYSAFSAWGTTPDDMTARSQVLTAAKQVVQTFNSAAQSAGESVTQANRQLSDTVAQINHLTSKIVAMNGRIRNGDGNDPSLKTQLYNDLQQLSSLVPIDVHTELDGTSTVLMNGQIPLVIGVTQNALQVGYPPSPSATVPAGMPNAQISIGEGEDVTSFAASGGQLGGLLQVRNGTLPALIGSDRQQGSLNQLAQGIADRINALLTSGEVSPGVPGVALFTYSSGSPAGVAGSLALNPAITASNLAAVQPGPPQIANGIATQLAGLQKPTNSADMIAGVSFADFYGNMASDLGNQAADASQEKDTQTDLLNQAENLRSQVSGISLDDQAAQLLKYQQAYQASSKLITVINEITGDLMNIIR